MPSSAGSKGAPGGPGDGNDGNTKPPVVFWSPSVSGAKAAASQGKSRHGRNPSTAESTLSGISSVAADDDAASGHSVPGTSSSTLENDSRPDAQAAQQAAAAAAATAERDKRRGPAIRVYRRGKDGYLTGNGASPPGSQQTDARGKTLKMSPVSSSPILNSMPGIGSSIAGLKRPENLLLGLFYDAARALERFVLSMGTFDFLFVHLFLSFLPLRLDYMAFCFLGLAATLQRAVMLQTGGHYSLLAGLVGVILSLDLLTYSWMRASSLVTTLADIVVYSQFTAHLTSLFVPGKADETPPPADASKPTPKEAAAAMASHLNPHFTIFGMSIPHLSISLFWSSVLLTSLSAPIPTSMLSKLLQAHIVAASIHGGLRDTVLRYAEMKTELGARVDRVRGERWRDYVGKSPEDAKGHGSKAATAHAPGNSTEGRRSDHDVHHQTHKRQGSTSSNLSVPEGSVTTSRSGSGTLLGAPTVAVQRRKGSKKSKEHLRKDSENLPPARNEASLPLVKAGGAAVHARRLAGMEEPTSTDPSALYANFYEAEDRFELIFCSFVNDPTRGVDSDRCEIGWIVPASLKASLYVALKIDGELRKFKQERERDAAVPGGKGKSSKKHKDIVSVTSSNPVMEELLRSLETESGARVPDEGQIRVSGGLSIPISRISVKVDGETLPREKWTIAPEPLSKNGASLSLSSLSVTSEAAKYAWWDIDGDEDDVWTPAPLRMVLDISAFARGRDHEVKVGVLGFWSVGAKVFLRLDPRQRETPKPALTYEEQANQLISEAFGHSKPTPQSTDDSSSILSTSPFASMTTITLRAHMEKDQEAIKHTENGIKRLRRDHQRNMANLRDEIAALKKTIAKEEASDERNRKRMQVLGEQMENLRLSAESTEDEMASLRSQLSVEEARRDAIGKELKELKKKKERMERLAASGGGQKQQAEFAELEAQISQQDKNNRHLQATIGKLSAKLVQLKINREELNTRIALEREKQAAAIFERQQQEALNESYRPLIEQMQAQSEMLRQQNEAALDILNQERAFNDTIRAEMRKLGLLPEGLERHSPAKRMEDLIGDLPLF